MSVFWVVLGVVLVLVLGNAWWMDRRAARQGKVLVPVKRGFGRTAFVAVDREEREAAQRAALVADDERERAERRAAPAGAGYLHPAEAALSFLGFGRRRGR